MIDLGVDVDAGKFLEAAKAHNAGVIGFAVKVMVGGAPTTEDFAASIGAEEYSAYAPGAVEMAQPLNESV